MKKFVALDFETANQNYSSVCSIGLVIVEDNRIVDSFYELIKPIPEFYSYFNTQVHGLTQLDTARAKNFGVLWPNIKTIIGDLPLVAHNSRFDQGCLKAVLNSYNLPLHQNEFYCTYLQSKKVFPNLLNHKLPTVAAHVGYDLKNHHDALADAEACAHIAMHVFK